MRSRTRMIAAGAAVAAALAAGGGAAVASATGGKPGAPATSSSQKAGAHSAGSGATAGQRARNALIASVAGTLHVSTADVTAALQPMFAVGYADPASPSFAAAARALGVSTAQLNDALVHAKLSLAGTAPTARAKVSSAKSGGPAASSKPAGDQQGHAVITAAVARSLHVSVGRVSVALRPVFAAGHADPASPAFAAAARALGVSTAQLNAALASAKQSLAAAG